MGKHSNLPFHFYVNVENKHLGPQMPAGVTRGIWHGIYARENQTLMCHVLLESGANWSGLPIHAISTTENFDVCNSLLMPWASMGENLDVWHSKYLEGLSCNTLKDFKSAGRHTGIVVDWSDGYSRYPEEHKPLNLLHLQNGQFALLPNNFVIYKDAHFTNEHSKKNLQFYKRGEKVYWGN